MKKILLLCACVCAIACACSSNNLNNNNVKVLARYENVSYKVDHDTSELTIVCENYVHKTYNYTITRLVKYSMEVDNIFFERYNAPDTLIIYTYSI